VARALTPDELTRYPWASQIGDFVPVGRLRTIAVLIGIGGFFVLVLGCIISLAAAENIRHAVTMSHWPTAAGMYGGIALAAVGAALGAVTLVQWLSRRGSLTPLVWSIGAFVPLLVIVFLIRPAIH
jgi:hypothetical protein